MTIHGRVVKFAAITAIAVGGMLPIVATPAGAQQCPQASPSDVTCNPEPAGSGQVAAADAAAPVQVKAVQATRGGLPVTGGDVVGLTIVGLGAVGGGIAMVRFGRRRATSRS
ncbi:MAG: hypothetical protein U0V73_13835 [Acidimicrobiia bacterium]